ARRIPHPQASPRRAVRAARAAPLRAHRVLLPDARLAVRGRRRRAGHHGARVARLRALRRALRPAVVALPDRHQRLLRHARGTRAPRPADGPRSGRRGRSGGSARVAGDDLDRADARCAGGLRRRRSGRGRAGAREHPPRLRGRPAASAAAAAGGADPLRGAALEGQRGGGAARHERRLGQQRPAAGPRDARRPRCERHSRRAAARRGAARPARPLRGGVRALRHGRADRADPRGRDPVDAAVRPVAARPRPHPRLVGRSWRRLPRLAGHPHAGRQRRPGLRAVQAERVGLRLRPVGAAGARDRRRPDRRVHLLPGHRHGVSAVRPAAAPRRRRAAPDEL
ncbi:MAG: RNA polymerase sigma factor, partial [uncultured Solirubrobacteraceae bacterium]